MATAPTASSVPLTLQKFPKSSLIAAKPCGQGGGFGNVITGTLDGKFITIKILHAPIAKKKVQVLQQMSRLDHRNLIKFIGIIDLELTDCPQLVFKHANKGNLLEWLRDGKGPSDEKTLRKFSCDIINGMEYLHNMGFIHGCLAARNMLIDEFCHTTGVTYVNVKISDYGMTQIADGMGSNYYKGTPTAKSLPIRWMPKEALPTERSAGEVTRASDVWGFAVVIWEMWTKGDIPYGITTSNTEVRQNILDGSSPLTFHRPVNCPEQFLIVMKNIFKTNQEERPTFVDLRKSFDSIQGGKQSYKGVKQSEEVSWKGKSQQSSGKDSHAKQSNPKEDRNRNKQDFTKNKNANEAKSGHGKGNFDPNQQKPGPKNQTKQNNEGAAPPPYTPIQQMGPSMQMPPVYPGMAFNPQQGFPQAGVGMPMPGYYPQQMNAGMGQAFPYNPNQMAPPPPYAIATATDTAEQQAQLVRDLQNKISALEMKQLEDKVQELQKQQRLQQKPNSNSHKPNPNKYHQGGKPVTGQQGSNNGQQGTRNNIQSRNSGQQQGQGFDMPAGWMPIAGAAIAGMAAGVAAATAASKGQSSQAKGKKK